MNFKWSLKVVKSAILYNLQAITISDSHIYAITACWWSEFKWQQMTSKIDLNTTTETDISNWMALKLLAVGDDVFLRYRKSFHQ